MAAKHWRVFRAKNKKKPSGGNINMALPFDELLAHFDTVQVGASSVVLVAPCCLPSLHSARLALYTPCNHWFLYRHMLPL
jgi:hypothetical protein